MPASDKPFVSLRKHRLPRNSKEVAYVLKRLKDKRERELKVRMADIRAEMEAARIGARVPKIPGLLQPGRIAATSAPAPMKPPRNAAEGLRPWKRALAPTYDAMRYEIQEQQRRLRSMRKNSRRLFGISGDPTLLDFLDVADSITVAPSPLVDGGGGSFISVIPLAPATSIAPFNNLVRFTSFSASERIGGNSSPVVNRPEETRYLI